MALLDAHLREPGDHGQLAFHPQCPACRDERLAGALPADAIVNRRTQALLAAGVLAVSSAGPTAAFAQAGPPDQEQEGTAAPEDTAGDPASDPDFDPGGESTDLPFDAGPPPAAQVAPDPDGDAGVLEQEPATDEDAPMADLGDEASAQPSDGQQPAPTTGAAPPAPSTAPKTLAEPAPALDESPAAPAPPDPEAESRAQARTRDETYKRSRQNQAEAPPQSVRPESAPEPAPVVVESEPSEATTVQVVQEPSPSPATTVAAQGRAARPGDRVHVVLAGESLWSIASDVLGADASVAKIARNVNQLWALNSERIGTGDRNLLLVGTRLMLR